MLWRKLMYCLSIGYFNSIYHAKHMNDRHEACFHHQMNVNHNTRECLIQLVITEEKIAVFY